MALADRILTLKLVADVSDINKGVNKASGKLKGFARGIGSWTKAAGIGLAIEGVGMLTDALGNAWDGFREGEKAAARLGNTFKRLKQPAAGVEKWVGKVSDKAKELGVDDVEAIDAFNKAMLATGDQGESWNRLQIAMDLVASGTAPNLGAAMKMIQAAAKGSAKVVDQFGLTADTAAGRVAQLGNRVKGAAAKAAAMDPVGTLFNALNEDLEGIVGSLATGDFEGAAKALGDVGTDVGTFLDTVGPKVAAVLDSLTGGRFSEFVDGLRSIVDDVGPKAGAVFDSFVGATAALIQALSNVLDALQPVINALAPAVEGSIGFVMEALRGVMQLVTDLLNGDFDKAWTDIGTTIGNLATIVTDTINKVLTGLQTILPDIAQAALDIGNSILTGIVDTIAGIADTITGILRDAINGLIDILNGLQFTLPGFEIPIPTMRFGEGTVFDTGPLGGGSFQLWGAQTIDPFDIPHLAGGGIVTRPTLAMLGEHHRAEAVVPLDRAFGTININVGVGDPVAIGRELDRILRQYRMRLAA